MNDIRKAHEVVGLAIDRLLEARGSTEDKLDCVCELRDNLQAKADELQAKLFDELREATQAERERRQ